MNILIISTNRSSFPMPVFPAGACLVVEATGRAGHEVTFLDLMFKPEPMRAVEDLLRKTSYDVIALSVRNIDNNDMHGTAFYIKELVPLVEIIRKFSKASLVIGGAAVIVMPEQIMRVLGINCAVIGEGETAFPCLLNRMERNEPFGDLPGVAFLEGGQFKANHSPSEISAPCCVPDYKQWIDIHAYRAQMATAPLQTKLGCQFQCVYCTYRKIEGETYRLAEPEWVAESTIRLASSGLHDIEFVDNVFNAPYNHALEVCESLIRARVQARFLSLELNPAFFHSDLLNLMEQAGFAGIGMTVESAADPVLLGLRKGFDARQVHHAADIIGKSRLPCVWIFMLGGPGETEDTVKETLRFAAKHIRQQDAVFFNVGIRVYPGTGLESIAREQGVLSIRPEDMLEPVFYVSPSVKASWIRQQVDAESSRHMNFMSNDSLSFPYLPMINRMAYRLGVRAPLWRYTRHIRRGLRFMGMKA